MFKLDASSNSPVDGGIDQLDHSHPLAYGVLPASTPTQDTQQTMGTEQQRRYKHVAVALATH
jgi:hypothetical protein